MSIPHLQSAWKAPLSAIPKFVLVCLADAAKVETGKCWPSARYIAHRCGMSERAVWDAINLLENEGYVVRVRTARSNHYTVILKSYEPNADAEVNAESASGSHAQELHTPHATPAEAHTHAMPIVSAPHALEPLKNRKKNHQLITKKAYSVEFEDFWRTYPANSGSKAKASQSFERAIHQGVEYGTIVSSACAYASHLQRTGEYVAHAATWLNQQRWEVNYAVIAPRPVRHESAHERRGRAWAEVIAEIAEQHDNQLGSEALGNWSANSGVEENGSVLPRSDGPTTEESCIGGTKIGTE